MKIALVTDAWAPQVNGVVRTLTEVTNELRRRGHEVLVVSPDLFATLPCPTYPEIRLALAGKRKIGKLIEDFGPDAVHIATEGPLGWAARGWCLSQSRPFSTAFHTAFPDYLARRTGLPASLFWPPIRQFHKRAKNILVATQSMREKLRANDLPQVRPWTRGVDLANFEPSAFQPELYSGLQGPIQLYVGRVAVEKNLEAFLSNSHPGSKVVVGDGPAMAQLKDDFPDALFLGKKSGRELAACYVGADVFVFPSRTDTFGLVMIEALACGTPVAAYPVTGPIDVLTSKTGAMSDNLEDAIADALRLNPSDCVAYAKNFTWPASADQFLEGLAVKPADPPRRERQAMPTA